MCVSIFSFHSASSSSDILPEASIHCLIWHQSISVQGHLKAQTQPGFSQSGSEQVHCLKRFTEAVNLLFSQNPEVL